MVCLIIYYQKFRGIKMKLINSSYFRLPFLFIFVLLFTQNLLAQTLNTATIRGQVLDPSGAAVANAAVSIKNPDISFEREIHTDGSGFFGVAGLPLTGKYQITVSSTGF